MITEVVYTFPSPTINIGGEVKYGDRYARVKFVVCIDSGELDLLEVDLRNTNEKDALDKEDLDFLQQVIDKINLISGRKLEDLRN